MATSVIQAKDNGELTKEITKELERLDRFRKIKKVKYKRYYGVSYGE
jgi:hypothetical protein